MSIQTSAKQETKWLAILQVKLEIVEAAEQERWSDLPLQAEYRDKLIRDYFSKPLTVDNALEVQDQITQIMALDEQVLGMARRGQDETRAILRTLGAGASAVKAYTN